MKCELVRDDRECLEAKPDLKQTVVKEIFRNGAMTKRRFWILGAIIDHPKAFRLVQMGIAIPADDECKERANMSDEQLKAAQHASVRLSKGIASEDHGLYDRGVIVGYLPDGSYDPGPNFHELEEAAEAFDIEDDELATEEGYE